MTNELSDMRAAMAELNRTMGRIESTVVATNQMIERGERRFDDQDKRLRSVEKWQNIMTGGGMLLGSIVGWFVKGHVA